jgi:hypothetical protein
MKKELDWDLFDKVWVEYCKYFKIEHKDIPLTVYYALSWIIADSDFVVTDNISVYQLPKKESEE